MRSAWDGGNISPLTKSNRIRATGAHICLIAHITQDELRALLGSADIWNGFANRMLWTHVRRRQLLPLPQPMPQDAVDELAKRLSRCLYNYTHTECLQLSPDAADLWEGMYPSLSRDLPAVLGAITARAEAQVLRVALIYALLDGADKIQPDHLQAAIALWQYCHESAQYIFGDAETDPDSNRILQALTSGPITQTELNKVFSGHLKRPALTKKLSTLEAAGRIEQQREKTRGRDKTIWQLRSPDQMEAREREDPS